MKSKKSSVGKLQPRTIESCTWVRGGWESDSGYIHLTVGYPYQERKNPFGWSIGFNWDWIKARK